MITFGARCSTACPAKRARASMNCWSVRWALASVQSSSRVAVVARLAGLPVGLPQAPSRPSPVWSSRHVTTEGFDEYERVRAEHRLLLDGFRRWGASEDDASGADDFLAWLG